MRKSPQPLKLDHDGKLSFPCTITLKVFMAQSDVELIEPDSVLIRSILIGHLRDDQVLGFESNASKSQRYVAWRCRLQIRSQSQLDSIYKSLREHERIVMVL
ncbi:MAG: DUF493 domain-containing protein [Pseudomonadota bacterium]